MPIAGVANNPTLHIGLLVGDQRARQPVAVSAADEIPPKIGHMGAAGDLRNETEAVLPPSQRKIVESNCGNASRKISQLHRSSA